jgi:lysophospholipase L1-like esterase
VIVGVAGTREVTVVDVTTITRERRHLVASDGLHPSAEMHRMWAEMVLPGAEAVLRG